MTEMTKDTRNQKVRLHGRLKSEMFYSYLTPEHGKCSPQLLTGLSGVLVVKCGDSESAVFLSFGYKLRGQVGGL
jgi:hypothetical protein